MNETPLRAEAPPHATPAAAAGLQLDRFIPQLIELGLLLLLIHQFELEGPAFFKVAALATGGFAIHHCLPLPYRLPFFCALSLASIGLVFGLQGSWLVSIGLLLLGACHVPIPVPLRALLLVLLGTGLAVMRAGMIESPWPDA